MIATVNVFSRSKQKFHATQRLTCRTALLVALAVVVCQVGVMTGQVGNSDTRITVGEQLYQNLSKSEFEANPQPPVSVQNISTGVKEFDNTLPPLSLKRIYPLTRNTPDADFHQKHSFSQPLSLQAYMRYKAGVKDAMEMVLITTGVSMGTFKRNFTAAGCMIADHVYPVDTFFEDRALCTMPKGIAKGAPITLVIFKDDVAETALRGPVTIGKEFVAELEDGDLNPLKKGTKLHGSLAMHNLGDLLAVRSRLVYENQLDPYSSDEYSTLPRYEVCLGTQIKPSTHLLPDWIDYHRRIGVDFVYVFDNHAEEDVSKLLAHRHDVEVVYWPWEKSQIQAFTYAVYAMRARCEWLLSIDTDEYVMVGLDGPDDLSKREVPLLKSYAHDKKEKGFAQIWLHWVIMKNSEYVNIPKKPVPEAYIHREDPQLLGDRNVTLGKTMVLMDKEWLSSNAHSKRPGEKAKQFDDRSLRMFPKRISDTAMIAHYRTRSWAEYRAKVKSGRANINNPKTVSLLKKWDQKGNEEHKEKYMRYSLTNRKVYTHFRDIWRRVTKELSVGKSVTNRIVDGQRCRTFYDLSRSKFAEPVREKCESEARN